MNTHHLGDAIQRALDDIAAHCQREGRAAEEVCLELAIKTRSVDEVEAAARALNARGHVAWLGQNRVQEAMVTSPAIRALNIPARLTLIGPLQTNKIRKALATVDEIETVDSVDTARAIAQRLEPNRDIDILIQVNTSGENTKSGVHPDAAIDCAAACAQLPGLHVRGFMTIGAHTDDEGAVRASFSRLRDIRDRAVTLPDLASARELSMGMSGDYGLAISEGSTRIRLGSSIFGPRY